MERNSHGLGDLVELIEGWRGAGRLKGLSDEPRGLVLGRTLSPTRFGVAHSRSAAGRLRRSEHDCHWSPVRPELECGHTDRDTEEAQSTAHLATMLLANQIKLR
jgi:hypothetical protein